MWKWYVWAGLPTDNWYYLGDITEEQYLEKTRNITKYLYQCTEGVTVGVKRYRGKSTDYRFERILKSV